MFVTSLFLREKLIREDRSPSWRVAHGRIIDEMSDLGFPDVELRDAINIDELAAGEGRSFRDPLGRTVIIEREGSR